MSKTNNPPKKTNDHSPNDTDEKPTHKLAKLIARAGYCSRRSAEELIKRNHVSVNGEVVSNPAERFFDTDTIKINNQTLNPIIEPKLLCFHKGTGVLVSRKFGKHDGGERQLLHQVLPKEQQNLLPVGRLDLNSEGLLLLTNHGGLKRFLESPKTAWIRKYRVRAYGKVTAEQLDSLKKGLEVYDEDSGKKLYFGEIIAVPQDNRSDVRNRWYEVSLREGKNREVRRAFETIGLQISRLIRISYGPFQLGNLEEGHLRTVPLETLKRQLGHHWADILKS